MPNSSIVIQADSKSPLLFLGGENGTVACRIHGDETSSRFPRFSENWTVECATRTLLRMRNLKAVRGGQSGTCMVGPTDYYGNLETPNNYAYSIRIQEGHPRITRNELADGNNQVILNPIDPTCVTRVDAEWLTGQSDKEKIQGIADILRHNSGQSVFGNSLFPNPGLLLINTNLPIKLKYFDSRRTNLEGFKARLVKNDSPFRIVDFPLESKNEFRVVGYHYEPGYAAFQVQNGGGLFLETHDFSQTMTPLDSNAGGFITLGRYNNGKLKLIAITIPFGYTLLVDKGCIHGDTTFHGNYMMSMTSDHLTMQTADTVFLKHHETMQNISITLEKPAVRELAIVSSLPAPKPIWILNNHSKNEEHRFWRQVNSQGRVIMQPGNFWAWKYSFYGMFHEQGVINGFRKWYQKNFKPKQPKSQTTIMKHNFSTQRSDTQMLARSMLSWMVKDKPALTLMAKTALNGVDVLLTPLDSTYYNKF
jgi:hypothetical protein